MALRPLIINEIIPPELLGEIFLHCIPPDALKHRQPDVTIAPMLLCHVCSHWREVALRTPRIWTHLYHAAYPTNPIGTFDWRDIAFLQWWLARVGKIPPYFRLEFRPDTGKKEDRRKEDTVDRHDRMILRQRLARIRVLRVTHRLQFRKESGKEEDRPQEVQLDDFTATMMQCMNNARYLSLDFRYSRLLRTLYGERPLSCPNLDTLALMHQGFEHDGCAIISSESYIPINNTQSVRRCVIENAYFQVDDLSLLLNFSNITHLHLRICTTLKGWFSLLRASVNLIYGSIIISFVGEPQCPVGRTQILSHLRQLSFHSYGHDLQQSFLDGFTLPALTGLRVDKHTVASVDYLHRLLVSTPALETLHVGGSFMVHPALLRSICIPGDLDPTMTSTPLSIVAPHLESLYFEPFTRLARSDGLSLARSVLTGDWLQLGRPGSRISCVHLGSHWLLEEEENMDEKARDMVDELRKSMPPGVELALRPVNDNLLWLSQWNDGFVDEFEDLIALGPWVP